MNHFFGNLIIKKNFVAMAMAAFLFVGCSNKGLSISRSGVSSSISGDASMFKSNSSLSLKNGLLAAPCTTAQASLYLLDTNGNLNPVAIATTAIDANGEFKFTDIKSSNISLQGNNIEYIIKAEGCNQSYFRPVTAYTKQSISGASTLLTLASEVTDTSKRSLTAVTRTEMTEAISHLNQAPQATSLDQLLDSIIASPDLKQKFESVSNVNAEKVKETPPTSYEIVAPTAISEGTSNNYSVTTYHWNPAYVAAYEWTLNGTVVSTSRNYIYSTSRNSQGDQQLVLRVGVDSSGVIDNSKTVRVESFTLKVANTYPAIAPTFALNGLTTPIDVTTIPLSISTGAGQVNCQTFSTLALTENSTNVPVSFPITCSNVGTQSLNYTLNSQSDGLKTLRLWARDRAGNVSEVSSVLEFTLDTQAPVVSITSAPSLINNATSQSLAFNATDISAIASYECKLDNAAFSTCSSPLSFSSLTQGLHTFVVRATDIAGNVSAPVSTSWTTDLTEPTLIISSAPSALTNSLTISIGFSATDSGGGTIASYLCQVDGGTFSTCTSPFISFLLSGSHTYAIKAIDSAGNISAVSSSTFTIDTTAPTVSITSKPSATSNLKNPSFSFAGTDTGGGSVAGYQCSLDAAAFASCTSPTAFSNLTAGTHTFSVRATDTAGNLGNSTSATWTIDLTTPVPSISAKPNAITNSTTANFSFSAVAPPDGSIASYECKLDAGSFSTCTSPQSFTGLTQAIHTFEVRSVDNNSNVSSSASFSWILDTTVPTITIAGGTPALSNSTSLAINFSSADTGGGSVAGHQCKIDSGSFASCSSPATYSSLAQGIHTFYVKATDSAGNVSSEESVVWTTDLTAPTVSISVSPAALNNLTTASFTFNAIDTGGGSTDSYMCSLDGAEFTVCTSVKSYASVATGAHTFGVKASDTAGNIGSATTFSWTIDRTAPVVAISSAPAANYNSTTANFVFAATDTGGGSIASYTCSMDGAGYSTCTSTKTYSSLTTGSHTFGVKALDTAGNESLAVTRTFVVDTTPPVTTITTPASNGTVIQSGLVTAVVFSGACETGLQVTFSGVSTSNTTCSSSAWTTTINLTSQTAGSLSLTASQTDAAGNTTNVTRTFIKDISGPTIAYTVVPTAAKKGGTSTTVQFSVTEPNISTSQNFIITTSTDNGATWAASGTVASTAGPLTAQNFSHTVVLPASTNTSTFKIRVEGTDLAGNTTITTSSPFIVDSNAPVITAFALNDNAVSTGSSFVNAKMALTDNLSGIDKVRFSDTSSSGDCQSVYADSNWVSWIDSTTPVGYNMATVDGSRKVCAWARDTVGNVSEISPSTGTLGVNADTIDYFVGFPPVINSLSVTTAGGGSVFTLNQPVTITWDVSDNEGLSNAPMDLYVSVNGGAWTSIATGYGSLSGNPKTSVASHTTYLAPSGVFRIKAVANDMNGNASIAVLSNILNSTNWSVYMGSNERGVGGSGTSVSMTKDTYGISGNQFAMNPVNGDLYAVSLNHAIVKLSAADGKTSVFMAHGSNNFSNGRAIAGLLGNTGALSINFDRKGRLYISNPDSAAVTPTHVSAKIWQVDFTTNKVNLYAGGGTEPLESATPPTSATSAHIISGAFDIDDQNNLYYFSTCSVTGFVSGTQSLRYRIMKMTQTVAGVAGTVSIIGGNCTTAAPSTNVAALSSGLGNMSYTHIRQIAVNGDGSVIYVTESTPVNGTYKLVYDAATTAYKIYSTSIGTRGIVFDRTHNLIYAGNGSINKVTLNANPVLAETITPYIASSGTGNCNDDSTDRTSACINSYGSNGWAPLEIANDGSLLFTDNSFRIRYIDSSDKIRTVMGTKPFYGEGLHRLTARGSFIGLHYKTNSLNSAVDQFPKGLYFVDTKAGVLGYVEPTTGIISIIAGNQEMVTGIFPADATVVSRETNMGQQGNTNFNGLNFDSNGLPVFGANGKIIRLTAERKIQTVSGGPATGGSWYLAADNVAASSVNFSSNFTTRNFAIIGTDYFYSLFVNNSVSNGVLGGGIGFINYATNKLRFLMKGVTADSSQAAVVDSAVSATVTTSALAGACSSQSCFIAVNPTDQNLYFSEGNIIRMLSTPTNPATVALTSPATLNMGRSARNFVFSPDNKRVYYISGSNMYCKWIAGTTAPVNCDNTTALYPAAGFTTLTVYSNQFTFIEDGKLLVGNGSEVYLFTYEP